MPQTGSHCETHTSIDGNEPAGEVPQLIGKVRARLAYNRSVLIGITLFIVISYSALPAAGVFFYSPAFSIGLFMLCALALAWRLRKLPFLPGVDRLQAAVYLDRLFQSRGRFITHLDLSRSAKRTKLARAQQEYIEFQLSEHTTDQDVAAFMPLIIPRRMRRFLLSTIAVWLLIFMLLYITYRPSPVTENARLIMNLLEQQQSLPEAVREELQELAAVLDEEDLTEEEIQRALDEAESELQNAQSELAANAGIEEDGELEFDDSEAGELSEEHSQTVDQQHRDPQSDPPQQQPLDSREQEKEEQEQQAREKQEQDGKDKQESQQAQQEGGDKQDQNDKDGQNSGEKQKQEEQQGQKQAQQGQGKKQKQDDKGQDQQSASGGKKGKKGEGQGEGQGQGKSSKQNAGQQGKQGESESQQGQQGESGDENGAQNQQGQAAADEQKQAGQKGEQGEQKGDKGDQQNKQEGEQGEQGDKGTQGQQGAQQGDKGSGSQQQALQQAQQTLDQVKKNLDKQGAGKPEDKPGKDQDKNAGAGRDGTKKDQPSQKQQGKKAGDKQGDQKDHNKQKAQTDAQKARGETPAEPNAESNSRSQNEKPQKNSPAGEAPAGKSSLPTREEAQRKREGDGGDKPGDGLDENRAYKEQVIGEQDEKLDTRYVEKGGKRVRRKGPAKFKRKLEQVDLPKPDPVKTKNEQPIPLEYRDVLQ